MQRARIIMPTTNEAEKMLAMALDMQSATSALWLALWPSTILQILSHVPPFLIAAV
jgi:hypothetical protein